MNINCGDTANKKTYSSHLKIIFTTNIWASEKNFAQLKKIKKV